MGALHASEPLHVSKTEIADGRLEAETAEFADESARAWLGVPASIPKGWRSKKARKEKRKAVVAAADSSPAPLSPQAGSGG